MMPYDELEGRLRAWMGARPITPDDAVVLEGVLERTRRLGQHRGWRRTGRRATSSRTVGGRPRPLVPAVALTLIVRSLASYGLHRAAHSVPLLWRLHRVHHCDTAVDLSTGLRHHPGELLYVAAVLAALAILCGFSVPALAGYELAASVFALWTHANLRLPARAEHALGWLFATPALHHVHHSAARAETDSNYGECLILWDRLFGTCRRLDTEGP